MKFLRFTGIAIGSSACIASVHAQSNLTLYGTIDTGVAYVHNSGGVSSQWQTNAGGLYGNSWGMTGHEDLGGGMGALFKLESNFNVNDGTLANNGRMFGGKSYVGLTSDRLGSVLLGRQNDPLAMLLSGMTGNTFSGFFAPPGDFDNYNGSMNFDNALTWISPNWSGVTVQTMYSVGGVAGAVGSGQSYSAAAAYSRNRLNLSIGFLHVDNGSARVGQRGESTADSVFRSAVNSAYASAHDIDIFRVAGNYLVGPVTLGTAYSLSEYRPDAASAYSNTEQYFNGSMFAAWRVTPALYAIAGYNFTKTSGDSAAKYHQFNLGGDYSLSKSTVVYAQAAYQHASGTNGLGAAQAVIGSNDINSNSRSQAMIDIGLRHLF
ncbi:porin [uncultured Caballeronia sp.]|uniref:porin n=1 Tax=uncultured Caballeronia sp. TaxID=1827198 RepID=UPI0035CBA8B9